MLFLFVIGCNNNSDHLVMLDGKAQGTSYHIVYVSADKADLKPWIDSILRCIDSSMSTYLPASTISRMNNNDTTAVADQHFTTVFNKATEVAAITNGLFDVTIAPLVNAWGFGFTKKERVDSLLIDSLRQFVGYRLVRLESGRLVKLRPQASLDFNAIAQGYTVDVLCRYLEEKGITNYLVELGGELRSGGSKFDKPWQVGIDLPEENNDVSDRKLNAVISLKNMALATSGNYRKFYEEDGERYAHIIDPRTGYPAKQQILSATVLASDCMTADAFATAFMVMGLNDSKSFLNKHPELNLEVHFIYNEGGKYRTFASASLQDKIKAPN